MPLDVKVTIEVIERNEHGHNSTAYSATFGDGNDSVRMAYGAFDAALQLVIDNENEEADDA